VKEAEQLIAGFLKSPRAGQMAQATRMFAEAEFWLSVSDHDPHGPPLLLTGYLDRLYQDAAGKWHVVDFKTNRVTVKTMPQIAADYEMQMLVYALAAERILGQAPASLTLHFLRGGLERSFAWDDAARQRATEKIRAGIAQALASVVS
jgi:ATP-dependent exoDNAse (exonuclease V) beta subunit